MEVGGSIRDEEAGFGNENGVRVEYRGLKEVTQDGVVFGVSLKWGGHGWQIVDQWGQVRRASRGCRRPGRID